MWSDERVVIMHHAAVLFMQGTHIERVLRKPSPDDRVVRLSIARALNDKANRDVVAGRRSHRYA